MKKESATEEKIILGKFTQASVDEMLGKASEMKTVGERIVFLSAQFLDIGYGESTLIGDEDTPEVFVINLDRIDCFTFLDYIVAMSLSVSFIEFKYNLKKVRYRSGIVSFVGRNHFFTDWKVFNADIVYDITEKIGGKQTVHITKVLNIRKDGTLFLPGIQPFQREILYIPAERIDDETLNSLQPGDFLGIYSHEQGLDVSHVGIVIKDEGQLYLRHASSRETLKRIVDQDLKENIGDKPGILIFRPC